MRGMHQMMWIAVLLFGPASAVAFAQQDPGQEPRGEQQQQEQQQQHPEQRGEQEQPEQQRGEQQQGEQQQQQGEQQQREPQQRGEQGQAAEPQVEPVRGMSIAIRLDVLNEEVIRKLQQQLKQRGHFEGEVDGSTGNATTHGIEGYQEKRGMEATGQLDIETARALDLGIFEEVRPVRGMAPEAEGQAAAEGGDPLVRAAQERLAEEGFYEASVDGMMGPNTQSAIRAFQEQNEGLEATGELDEATQAALGLDAPNVQQRIEQERQQQEQQQPQGERQQQEQPQGEEQQRQQQQEQEQEQEQQEEQGQQQEQQQDE